MSDGATEMWKEEVKDYMKKADNINPNHYRQGKVECIDALEAATTNLMGLDAVCTANAIKYLWRWQEKGGVEDLKKSIWYINKLIDGQPRELS